MSIRITPVPTKLSVAFLGLGAMGYPMAGHLARAGHPVTVYNRTESKALQWVAEYERYGNVKRAAMPVDAAWKAKVVFACVDGDEALCAVALGKNGAFAGMKPGTVFINHSTVSVDVVKMLMQEADRRAVAYMNAPIVAGGVVDAQNGALAVTASALPAVYERVKPIVSAYAQSLILENHTMV